MTTRTLNRNSIRLVLLAALVCSALLFSLIFGAINLSGKAESGPASGSQVAEITMVSKDKSDLKFIYLSGILLNKDIPGLSYDEASNTLTLNNVELSKDDTHYSLTITNMGDDFKLNVVGTNSLDYLSLEATGYDTGCTITGCGTLDIGYLDIESDGAKLNVTVDNTVTFNIDSSKMGYENLPAIKVVSKDALTEMESMVQILGKTDASLTFEETSILTSYAYETTTSKINVTPTRMVKQGEDGTWGYYVNDKLDTTYNGLAGNAFGTWKISNGLVDFEYFGLCEETDGTYLYVNEGKADFTFNGFVRNQYGMWFVQNGVVQFDYSGYVAINGQKYDVDKGLMK